jgi:hypothetical protein
MFDSVVDCGDGCRDYHTNRNLVFSDWAKNARQAAIEDIIGSANCACAETHHMSLYCKSSNRIYQKTCPYCLSFSLWFYTIFAYNNAGWSSARNDCIYTDFYGFGPEKPCLINFLTYGKHTFFLPLKVSRFLYKKNLEWLFYNIYCYVSHIIIYCVKNKIEIISIEVIRNILETLPQPAIPNNIGFRNLYWEVSDGKRIKFQYVDGYCLLDVLRENNNIYAGICNSFHRSEFGIYRKKRYTSPDDRYGLEPYDLIRKYKLISSSPY